jgi:hypothetical protein
MAVDGRYAAAQQVLAAAVLAFCAALTKEIGIAVTGTMLLYDLLLAPQTRQPGIMGAAAGRQGAGQQLQPSVARRQLLRVVLVGATAVAYVKMRQWVAVEQLVNIFRKVITATTGLSSMHLDCQAWVPQLYHRTQRWLQQLTW